MFKVDIAPVSTPRPASNWLNDSVRVGTGFEPPLNDELKTGPVGVRLAPGPIVTLWTVGIAPTPDENIASKMDVRSGLCMAMLLWIAGEGASEFQYWKSEAAHSHFKPMRYISNKCAHDNNLFITYIFPLVRLWLADCQTYFVKIVDTI